MMLQGPPGGGEPPVSFIYSCHYPIVVYVPLCYSCRNSWRVSALAWISALCMSQQLGNEVERQGKARQTSQLHPGQLFLFKEKRRVALGFEPTTLRQGLYQLSYQGNSAGRGSNLQHNTTQGKPQTTVLWHSILSLSMYIDTSNINVCLIINLSMQNSLY